MQRNDSFVPLRNNIWGLIIMCPSFHAVLMGLSELLCHFCQGRVKVRCVCFGFWEDSNAVCMCVCAFPGFLQNNKVCFYWVVLTSFSLLFFPFSLSFATTEWFPEKTNWAQKRQMCKCLNLVSFSILCSGSDYFSLTLFVHILPKLTASMSKQWQIHPLYCTQMSPQPVVIATVEKTTFFFDCTDFCFQRLAQLLFFFFSFCTDFLLLLLLLPMLFPLPDFPPQIIFSDHSRVLRFPCSI